VFALTLLSVKENAKSPLLGKLPIEVREKIWGYVLGNCTVHIKFAASHRWEPKWRSRGRGKACYSFSGRFFYILCEAAASEQDGYLLSKSADYDLLAQGVGCDDVRLSFKRHSACYSCYDDCLDAPAYSFGDQYVGGPKDPHRLARNRISISVLRVCRQVYVEVNQLLWRTTTWSFTHALAFSQFMDRRNAVQRRLMRKLHLDLDPRYCWVRKNWADGWHAALHKRVLSRFTGLEVLHLDITDNQYGPRQANRIGHPAHPWWPNVAMDELVELQFLPLEHVTVTCTNTSKCDRWPHHSKMDFGERLVMADEIRSRLLDYQGKEAQLRAEEERAARLEEVRVRRLEGARERQERLQQEECEVRDLENRLDAWLGQCPLCHVRQYQGCTIDARHPLEECPEELRALVVEEVGILQSVRFDRSGSCGRCALPREIWLQWEEVGRGSPCFQEVDSKCRYQGIVKSVVAAIMTAGPLEIVEETIYARMKAQGIWGAEEKLDIGEVQQVKQGMLRWFGQPVEWGGIDTSILLRAFYWLTVGLEEWRIKS
jgi:hypothetical protein